MEKAMNLISGMFGGGKKNGPSAGELAQQRDQRKSAVENEQQEAQLLANQMNLSTLRKRLSLAKPGLKSSLGG
jgi:hypothetical protein